MKKRNLLTTLFAISFTICLAAVSDLTGKWVAEVKTSNGSVQLFYNFKVDGQNLTGSLEGPQGTVDITNGKIIGTDFSFDIQNTASGTLHQTGKFYGDSTIIDFETRVRKIHLKLLRAQ